MIDHTIMQYISLGLEFLVIPIFGMVWSVQGRISRMEGEIQALYKFMEIQQRVISREGK